MQGVEAVNCLLAATAQTPSYMIGICENKITKIPLVEAVKQVYYLSFLTQLYSLALKTQAVAKAIEALDFEKAVKLRDPEFAEAFAGFVMSSSLDPTYRLPAARVCDQ